MFRLVRTNSAHQDFINLVALLDAELAERDGEDHAFYHQFNGIANLDHTLILYHNLMPIGCGAVKAFKPSIMEVKRMYVAVEYRGQGHASNLLKALENWAFELGCTHCILETGKRQPEAIQLYIKNGYIKRENYGQYKGVSNSICFEKAI